MKILIIVFSLLSLYSNAQHGNAAFGLGRAPNSTSTPGTGFVWANLTPQAPTSYNNCGTITITNKSFTNLNSGVLGGDNIQVGGSCNIVFRGCYFGPSIRNGATVAGLTGSVRFVSCLFVSNKVAIEGTTSSGSIMVDSSECINPWGMTLCKGQFIQFAGTTGAGSYIKNNRMENFRGEGNTEDWISMFGAQGTSGSYITISNNMARGGGPSNSGGGFIAGDGDGRYILIENNKFFNVGNYITAVAGGDNIINRNNMGYAAPSPIRNIAMYAYLTNASSHCNSITMTGNSMLMPGSNNYYCYCTPTCGDVVGIDESQGNPVNGWLFSNSNSLTLAQLNFPTTLITFVDEDRLWHLRDESVQFLIYQSSGSCYDGDTQYPRPTSNAGANQSISITTATVSGSGSTSSDGFNYQWTIVSGPNVPTMSAPLAVSNNLSGLINGVYLIRLVVTNNSGAADASWMTVTKS